MLALLHVAADHLLRAAPPALLCLCLFHCAGQTSGFQLDIIDAADPAVSVLGDYPAFAETAVADVPLSTLVRVAGADPVVYDPLQPLIIDGVGPVEISAWHAAAVEGPQLQALSPKAVKEFYLLSRAPQTAAPVCEAPRIDGADTLHASFVPNEPGHFRLQLAASDGCTTYTDSVVVEVECGEPAVADAGADVVARWDAHRARFEAVALDGSGSDSGLPTSSSASNLHYRWLVRGEPRPAAEIRDLGRLLGAGEVVEFRPERAGAYLLELVVNNGCSTSSDFITVTADCSTDLDGAPLAADAGPDEVTVTSLGWEAEASESRLYSYAANSLFPAVRLDPHDSNMGAHARYQWVLLSYPSGAAEQLAAVFDEEYFEAWEESWDGRYGQPVVETIQSTYGDTIGYDDNTALSAAPQRGWVLRPAEEEEGFARFTPPVEGDYVIQLIATNPCFASTDTVVIHAVCDDAPAVDAGADIVVRAANRLAFARSGVEPLWVPLGGGLSDDDAYASTDGNIEGMRFLWYVDSIPTLQDGCVNDPQTLEDERLRCDGSLAFVRNENHVASRWPSAPPSLFVDRVGTYTVVLRADTFCASRSDSISVRVECNAPPVAIISGNDRVVQLGPRNSQTTVTFDSRDSFDPDPDDTRIIRMWRVVDAPDGAYDDLPHTVKGPTGRSSFQWSVSQPGTYQIELSVSDYCSSTTDSVVVEVMCNRPPVAAVNMLQQNATYDDGEQRFDVVVLDAMYSSDPDGIDDIVSFSWALDRVESSGIGGSQTVSGDFGGADAAMRFLSEVAVDDPFPTNAIVQFDAPVSEFATPDDALAALSSDIVSSYVYTLSVSDACSTSSVEVVVETRCSSQIVSHTTADATITWNAAAGSRWTEDGDCSVSFASEDGCELEVALDGSASEGAPADGVSTSWLWLSTPSDDGSGSSGTEFFSGVESIADPTALTTSFSVPIVGYDNANPFEPSTLGEVVTGQYVVRLANENACLRSTDVRTIDVQCNDPPVITMPEDTTVVRQSYGFDPVSVSGVVALPGGDDELDVDAPTFRFEWTISHTATSDPDVNTITVSGDEEAGEPKLTGFSAAEDGIYEAFVTSTTYSGDLGGVAGADAICQAHAAAGNHIQPEAFKAHLCDSAGGLAAHERFANAASGDAPVYSTGTVGGAYAQPDNIGGSFKVACGSEADCSTTLASSTWQSAVQYDEFGNDITSLGARVYNGCGLDGATLGDGTLCQGYTSDLDTEIVVVGLATGTGQGRYNFGERTCAQEARLMCVRDAKLTLAELNRHVGPYQTLSPSFTPNKLGHYDLELVATDGCTSTRASMRVTTVCPSPPVPNAGENATSTWDGTQFSEASLVGQVTGEVATDWQLVQHHPILPGTAAAEGFVDAVLGLDSEEEGAAFAGTGGQSTMQPTKLGAWELSLVATDSCSIVESTAFVVATCNTPPTVPAEAAEIEVMWDGTGFPDTVLSLFVSDDDGDTLNGAWAYGTVAAGEDASLAYVNDAVAVAPADASGLDDTALLEPTFSASALGRWTYTIDVDDGCSVRSTTAVVETRCNQRPTADAGASQSSSVWEGTGFSAVLLSAADSNDFDGDALTYVWEVVSHAAVDGDESFEDAVQGDATPDLDDASLETPSLSIPKLGTYALSVTTTDGCTWSDTATVTVEASCNTAPQFQPDPTELESVWDGDSFPQVELTVEIVDSDPVTVVWTQGDFDAIDDTEGYEPGVVGEETSALSSTSVESPTFTPTVAGLSTFSLVASDGCSRSTRTLTVQAVCNTPPSVSLIVSGGDDEGGSLWTGSAFQQVLLDGSLTDDADVADVLSDPLWVVTDPSGELVVPDEPVLTDDGEVPVPFKLWFTPTETGVYTATLTTSDGCSVRSAQVTILAYCADAPVVDAGVNVTVTWDASTGAFSGFSLSGNVDASGNPFAVVSWAVDEYLDTLDAARAYEAAVTAGASGSAVTLDDSTSPTTTGSVTHAGTYILTLSADDSCPAGDAAQDWTFINVGCGAWPVPEDIPDAELLWDRDGGDFGTWSATLVASDSDQPVDVPLAVTWSATHDSIDVDSDDDVVDAVQGADAGSGLEEDGSSVTLTPTSLGSWTIAAAVSDGCGISYESATVDVVCGEPVSLTADITPDTTSSFSGSAWDELTVSLAGTDGVASGSDEWLLNGVDAGWSSQGALVRGVTPDGPGDYHVAVSVNDGCSITRAEFALDAECLDDMAVSIGSDAEVQYSEGAFAAVALTAAVDNPSDPADETWTLTGPSLASLPADEYGLLDGFVHPLLDPTGTTESTAEAEGSYTLTPARLGTWTVQLNVADLGCQDVSDSVVVTTVCNDFSAPVVSDGEQAFNLTHGESVAQEVAWQWEGDGEAASTWEFVQWDYLTHECGPEFVGSPQTSEQHNEGVTNPATAAGGVCALDAAFAPATLASTEALTHTVTGAGRHTFRYTAFDGCNLVSDVVAAYIGCPTVPVAAVQVVGDADVVAAAGAFEPVYLDGRESANPAEYELDGEDEPLPPLSFIWAFESTPSGSALSGGTGLSHPDATTAPLFSSALESATPTYTRGGVGVLDEEGGNREALVTFTPDVYGEYHIRLTVHDGCAQSSEVVVVRVDCPPLPSVDAGSDIDATFDTVSGSRVPLTVTVAPGLDSEGVPYDHPIFVRWTMTAKPEGSAADVVERHQAATGFFPDVAGVYSFRVDASASASQDLLADADASDGRVLCGGASDTVEVTVSCNSAPTAAIVSEPETSTWGVFKTPIPLSPDPEIADGAYNFVRDTYYGDSLYGMFESAADDLVDQFTIGTREPHPAFAPVELSALSSQDIDSDVNVLLYSWRLVSSPPDSSVESVSVSPSAHTATLLPDAAGTYEVELTASDGCSSSTITHAVVAACNGAPQPVVAGEAGGELLFELSGQFGDSDDDYVVLDARGTTDPDQYELSVADEFADGSSTVEYVDELEFHWELLEAPEGSVRSHLVLWDEGGNRVKAFRGDVARLLPDVPGSYRVRLSVSDGCQTRSIEFVVDAHCGAAPIANAGQDQEVLWKHGVIAPRNAEYYGGSADHRDSPSHGFGLARVLSAAEVISGCDDEAELCGSMDAVCHARASHCYAAIAHEPTARHLATAHAFACRGAARLGAELPESECPAIGDLEEVAEDAGQVHPAALARMLSIGDSWALEHGCGSFYGEGWSASRGGLDIFGGDDFFDDDDDDDDDYESPIYKPAMRVGETIDGVIRGEYEDGGSPTCYVDFGDPSGRFGVRLHVHYAEARGGIGTNGGHVSLWLVSYETGEATRIDTFDFVQPVQGHIGFGDTERFYDQVREAGPGEFFRVEVYGDAYVALSAKLAPTMIVELDGTLSTDIDTPLGELDIGWTTLHNPLSVFSDEFVRRGVDPDSWKALKRAGVTPLRGDDTLTPWFVVSATGSYSFRLTVSDGCSTATDTVTVNVLCAELPYNPVSAAASASFTATRGAWVDLLGVVDLPQFQGSAESSTYQDGVATMDALEVQWSWARSQPVVESGGLYVVKLGDVADLDRARFFEPDDPTPIADVGPLGGEVTWSVEASPPGSTATVADAGQLLASFTPDALGDYELRISVTRGCGSASSTAIVRCVCSDTPVVDILGPHRVVIGDTVEMEAVAEDSDTPLEELTWQWEIVGPTMVVGTAASVADVLGAAPASSSVTELRDSDSSTPSFVPDGVGAYTVRVTVSDGCTSVTQTTTVSVACSAAPQADTGGVQSFFSDVVRAEGDASAAYTVGTTLPASVSFSGSASTDADGDALMYQWTWVSAPADSSIEAGAAAGTASSMAFAPDARGAYVAELLVSDGCSVARDEAVAVVGHDVPFVNAAQSYGATVGEVVTLEWTRYVDSRGQLVAAAGAGVSFSWSINDAPEGSSASLEGGSTLTPSFSPDLPGSYVLTVTAVEGGHVSTDAVAVHADCPPPPLVAVRNASVAVAVGETATLVGYATTESSSLELAYQWALPWTPLVRKDGGASAYDGASDAAPSPSQAALADADSATATLVPDGVGEWLVHLEVTDGCSAAGASVAVQARCAHSLAVDAGIDQEQRETVSVPGTNLDVTQTIDLSQPGVSETVSVSAGVSYSGNADGLRFAWRWLSLPAGSEEEGRARETQGFSFTPDLSGAYVAEVTITDGCVTAVDTVTVSILTSTVVVDACPAPDCDAVVINPEAPAFVAGWPAASLVTSSSAVFAFRLDRPGTVHFVVLPSGSAQPSAYDIRSTAARTQDALPASLASGTVVAGAARSTVARIVKSGLNAATIYDLWCIAEQTLLDPPSGIPARMRKISFTMAQVPFSEEDCECEAVDDDGGDVVVPNTGDCQQLSNTQTQTTQTQAKFELRLDGLTEETFSEDMQLAFRRSVADSAGVDISRVQITGVKPVVNGRRLAAAEARRLQSEAISVEFTIVDPEDGSGSGSQAQQAVDTAAAAETLRTRVSDGTVAATFNSQPEAQSRGVQVIAELNAPPVISAQATTSSLSVVEREVEVEKFRTDPATSVVLGVAVFLLAAVSLFAAWEYRQLREYKLSGGGRKESTVHSDRNLFRDDSQSSIGSMGVGARSKPNPMHARALEMQERQRKQAEALEKRKASQLAVAAFAGKKAGGEADAKVFALSAAAKWRKKVKAEQPGADDWVEKVDARSGRKYYYSASRKQSMWRKPKSLGGGASTRAKSVAASESSGGAATGAAAEAAGGAGAAQGGDGAAGGESVERYAAQTASLAAKQRQLDALAGLSKGKKGLAAAGLAAARWRKQVVAVADGENDWVEKSDPRSGRKYYYSASRGQSVWRRPRSMDA